MRSKFGSAGSHALPNRPLRLGRAREQLRAAAGRADALAVELAASPGAALLGLLALDAALTACFVAGGLVLANDQAELFRELMPGTLLSFAQLLLIAAVAWAIHRRADGGRSWRRSLWGLSAVILLVFAFDEITQSAIYLSHLLERSFGVQPAGSFHDLEAVLLTLLFAAAALVVLPRLPALLRHPRALGLLALAVGLGLASQALDSFAPVTRWEFVAEESLKLAAEVFLAVGFLVVLRDVLARSAGATRPADEASAPRAA
jgi:hypothetical protein